MFKPTKLQTFTRRRNYAKGRMASCLHQLRRLDNDCVLSPSESAIVRVCIQRLAGVVDNWNGCTPMARRTNIG